MDKNKKEQTFKDLFSSIKEEKKEEKINFNSINKIVEKEEKNVPQESFNSLFEESSIIKNDSIKEENTKSFNNLFKEEKKEEISNKPENNQTVEQEQKEIQEEKNSTKEQSTETKEEQKEEQNPFFTNNEQITNIDKEILSSQNKEDIQEQREELPNQEKVINIDENIFFDTPDDKKENIKEITKQETNINKIEKKEVEEEKKINDILEENPFFIEDEVSIEEQKEEKINLIENINHDTPNNKNSKIDTTNIKHYNVKIVKKKDPPLKFIIGVLSYALFIWLLLIGLALLIYVADIKIRAIKGDTSSPTYNAYVVLTGSMLPEIQVYDVVVTKKIDAKDLQEGDIITFASSDTRFLNTIITHRIKKKYYDSEKKQYTFQTKGDNNNVADSALVQSNNIYGKVILKIPKLGYLQEFLASRGGWIVVILLPCLTVISYDIVKLVKGLKRKKYKNIKVQK